VTIYHWADLHVGHALVAGDRGFSTTTEHDESLAQAWVETVTKRDSVWILSDTSYASEARWSCS
jgi:calcineurin-like phosphoesterase family protein